MTSRGVEYVFIETQNWGATVAFWKRFGYDLEFETDHHSGMLSHPGGKPTLFVAERPGEQPEMQLCVDISDAASIDLGDLPVEKQWTAEHWNVMEAIIRDPDGRRVSLQAPLPDDVEVDHHDWYWLGARPTLEVADVASVLTTLVDRLGWSIYTSMGDPPTFALVGIGRATLALAHVETPAVPADTACCYVDVQGVDALHDHCVAQDLTITHPLTTHPYGQRDFVVRLPSGHLVALGERVG